MAAGWPTADVSPALARHGWIPFWNTASLLQRDRSFCLALESHISAVRPRAAVLSVPPAPLANPRASRGHILGLDLPCAGIATLPRRHHLPPLPQPCFFLSNFGTMPAGHIPPFGGRTRASPQSQPCSVSLRGRSLPRLISDQPPHGRPCRHLSGPDGRWDRPQPRSQPRVGMSRCRQLFLFLASKGQSVGRRFSNSRMYRYLAQCHAAPPVGPRS